MVTKMTTYDYENAYVSFKWLVEQAASWTNDHRQLSKVSAIVYDALLKLKKHDEEHDAMTVSQRDNVVGCLRTVHWAASQTDYDSVALAAEALNLLDTLNKLFVKEGLAPVTELYKK